MSSDPLFIEDSLSEDWNNETIERATAIALGPSATQGKLKYRYICSYCDRIVSTSRIIQNNLPNSGLRHDEAPEEEFAHYTNVRGLVQSAMRGCQLCSLLQKSFHGPAGPAGLSYQLVIRKDPPHIGIIVRGMTDDLGVARLPTFYRTDDPALDGLVRSHNTDSDETFACAATWLTTCLRQHEICSINRANVNFRPRRLIKGSIVDSQLSVQLVETQNIPEYIQYLTLSYCWGEAEGLELTKERKTAFCERIPLESLPKTFLDAVVVTARLGYQYIWIASLCIIQDCPRDRESEINAMRDIYKYTICTIAALSAKSSDEGCFSRRDPQRCDRYQSLDYESLSRRQDLDALPGSDIFLGKHIPPLHTRAWVVQERALSPRTLHCGSEMIYWECIQCRALECRPQMEDFQEPGGEFRPFMKSGMKNAFEGLLKSCRFGPDRVWRRAWRMMVKEYSACDLRCDQDKWSAFQGLAQEVENHCGDRLVGGLWRSDLRWELLWFANGPGPGKVLRTQNLKAPSWSWLAINGRIGWPEDFNLHFNHLPFNHKLVEWAARISSSVTSLSPVQPIKGNLCVEAPLVNFAEIFPRSRGPSDLTSRSEHPNVSSVSWYPDTAKSEDISPKWALQFARTTSFQPDSSTVTTYFGLVVREVEGSRGEWERLGLYQITWAKVDFGGSEPAQRLGTTRSIMLV